MTAFLYSFSHVLTKAIVQSLLSSFVIWLLVQIVLRMLRHTASAIRYQVYLAALLCSFVFFLLPFGELSMHNSAVTVFTYPQKAASTDISLSAAVTHAVQQPRNNLLDILARHSDLILLLYALGVLWFSVRLLFAYIQSQQLKQQSLPASELWMQRLRTAAGKIGIGRRIAIGFSEKVNTPCIIGYARATLLIPLSLAASLTPEQAEAVLLHELAHLKNADHYINIAVQCIRCLLFFNPFVWLMSRSCSLYRELACDELAARHGDSVSLAESLLQIARNRSNVPASVAALITNKHSLSFRIQNLLNMNYQTTAPGSKCSPGIATAFFTLALILFTGSRSLSQNKKTLHEQLAAIEQQLYDEGNNQFILVAALNDGLIQERQPYNVSYQPGSIIINGKDLPAAISKQYVTRFKNFLLSQGGNANSFVSFRGDGLKLEEILDASSVFRKKPVPAAMVRPKGQTFSDLVILSMVADKLLDSFNAAYSIAYKKEGVFLNGKKLEGATGEKYRQMFAAGEGFVPKTETDIVTMENYPDRIPHIYTDAKGRQRIEWDDPQDAKKERKDEPARQDR